MGDPTAETPAARSYRLRAYAREHDIFPDASQWGRSGSWFAVCMAGQAFVAYCAHAHRTRKAALDCAVKLVAAEAERRINAQRLFA